MISSPTLPSSPAPGTALARPRPRLGFLGVGWIGLNRLDTIAKAGVAEIAAIVDPSREMAARAGAIAPRATSRNSLQELMEMDLVAEALDEIYARNFARV